MLLPGRRNGVESPFNHVAGPHILAPWNLHKQNRTSVNAAPVQKCHADGAVRSVYGLLAADNKRGRAHWLHALFGICFTVTIVEEFAIVWIYNMGRDVYCRMELIKLRKLLACVRDVQNSRKIIRISDVIRNTKILNCSKVTQFRRNDFLKQIVLSLCHLFFFQHFQFLTSKFLFFRPIISFIFLN